MLQPTRPGRLLDSHPASKSRGALSSPSLSVVIVNYNSWDDVTRLVLSLENDFEIRSGRCEILVVDNGSSEPAPEFLLSIGSGFRLIERGHNGGFAVGVNAGWKASRAPWLLLLNPDVIVASGFLEQVVARVEGYQRVPDGAPGIVGFGLRNPEGTTQPSVGRFPSLGRTMCEQLIPRSRRNYQAAWRTRAGPVDWVTGACLLVNARMLMATGGLDEEFFLYYEEVALCRTARNLGWRVEYDPTIEVVHLRPLQNRPVTPRMRVITRHSKLLYFRKHLPRWQFHGLGMVIAVEAFVRGCWSRIKKRPEEQRSWQTVARMGRALRHGASLGGQDVLALADRVIEQEESTGSPTDRVAKLPVDPP